MSSSSAAQGTAPVGNARIAYTLMQNLTTLRGGKSGAAGAVQVTEDLTPETLQQYEDVGKITVQLVQLVYDSNYLDKTIVGEAERVGALNADSRKHIFKVRQMALAESYNYNYYKFVANVILFTGFVTMLCLAVGGALRVGALGSGLAFFIVGIVAILYAGVMMFIFISMKSRTSTDWNQYYFKPSKDVRDETILAVNTGGK